MIPWRTRAVGLGRRVRDGGRAQARLVGEHSPGDAEPNGGGDRRAGEAARRRGGGEGVGEDQPERRGHVRDVDQDDDDGGADVEHHHGRHESARDFADAPNAADDDDAHQRGHDEARQPRGDGEAVRQRGRHRVDLHGVADAERRHRAEYRERQTQPLAEFRGEFANAVAQVIHRSADMLAGLVHLPIGDRAHRFRVLRGHTEQRDQPHVEDRARAAERDRRRDARDISGADGGRERRHQRVERLDLAGAGWTGPVEQQPEAVDDLAPRHEHQSQGQQQAGDAQHAEHRRPPDKGVDLVDDGVQLVHGCLLRATAAQRERRIAGRRHDRPIGHKASRKPDPITLRPFNPARPPLREGLCGADPAINSLADRLCGA